MSKVTAKPLIFAVLLLSFSSASGNKNIITTADSLFDMRAEGSTSRRTLIDPANNALLAYNQAIIVYPDTIALHWKRLRAFHFLIEFVDIADSSRTELIDRAKNASDGALSKIETICNKRLQSPNEKTSNTLDCSPSDIAKTYFWSAINLGIWSRSQDALTTKVKSAKRIFHYAEKALAIDPTVDRGGSQRLLSVLHGTIPSIPFITGFINKDKVIPLIDEALILYPNHPGNRLLKAKALMNQGVSEQDRSQSILNGILIETPKGPWRVEWHKIRALAKKLLDEKNNMSR